MFTDPAQTVDNFVTSQVTEFLFTENPPTMPSMDLIALNIQRGRDHGLPGKYHFLNSKTFYVWISKLFVTPFLF